MKNIIIIKYNDIKIDYRSISITILWNEKKS